MKREVNEKKYAEKMIRSYSEKGETKLDELKALDRKAKKGASTFAYVFGSIGALVLGAGMSVAMGVILSELMWLGIVVGVIGLFMVSINYFIYKGLLNNGKRKYGDRILELSKELLNE